MFKKQTLSILVGLAALAIAAPASANDYYVRDYEETVYVRAPVPVASASPYATQGDTGFVFGIEGGYADTHWDNISFPGSSITSTGFAARGFLGYAFNQYLGVETGFIYLPTAEVTGDINGSIQNYAIDLLGKLSVPITSGFRLFAKAGFGYLSSSPSGDLDVFDSRSNVGPAFGVGAGYEVIPNLALNLSWMRYSGDGSISDSVYQPSPDAILFGLSYTLPMRSS